MEHIEILMEPIDTIQVEDVKDPEKLHAVAETMAAMLLATRTHVPVRLQEILETGFEPATSTSQTWSSPPIRD
jgi:hypothetical protein